MHLQTRSIIASKCISDLAQFQPPNSHLHGPPSESPYSLEHGLQVHLPTRSTTTSGCISKFTRSRCGETVELEGIQPILNIPPHLSWYTKRIHKKQQFYLEKCRKRVKGYEGIPGHDEPPKLRGSMNVRQEGEKIITNCMDLQSSARVHGTKTWERLSVYFV